MGEDKIKKLNRFAVREMLRGHNSTVAHAHNHTDGRCPKCANDQLVRMFCLPDNEINQPRMRGCTLDGEHIHLVCGACKYLWVERCWDVALANAESGTLVAEGDASMMLAALAADRGGVRFNREHLETFRGWIVHLEREGDLLTVTAEPAPPQKGEIRHPTSPEDHVAP